MVMRSRAEMLLLVSLLLPAVAEADDWRSSWDAALYGYASHMALRDDSVLNPGNQIAALPQRSDTAELRMNAKAENNTLRFTARGIGNVREQRNASGRDSLREAYLSQWQLRAIAGDGINVAIGRDVLNWGAAQFRSPASPYYFDSGRSDPMRELTGMDMLKLSWTPDRQHSVQLVRVVRAGDEQAQSVVWRDSWLAKFDQLDEDWAYGLVVASAPHLPAFYGVHGLWTVNDNTMLYGEWSSSAQRDALLSPADPALPFTLQSESPRCSTSLLGTSYTFENGYTLHAEYLHDGHGYSAEQADAYFARAAGSPLQAGVALGHAPRLLGRDYLYLVWQSNLMESDGYWRVMLTNNLADHGGSFGAYGEYAASTRISVYALGLSGFGNARQEATALFTRSVTLGVKVALP
ncbi:MAG: hypothetical protein PHH36_11775 [Sideroxydans sp.]|nr:hypothetical protein [Sideroxydans sp.]